MSIFNKIAKRYDDLYKKEKDIAIDNKIKKKVKGLKNKFIIDMGCGTGHLLELINVKKEKYIGIDISHEMLKIAKKRYPGYKFIQKSVMDNSTLLPEKGIYIFLFSLNYMDIKILNNIKKGNGVIVVILTKERVNSKEHKEIYGNAGQEIDLTKIKEYIKIKTIENLSKDYIYIEGVVNGNHG